MANERRLSTVRMGPISVFALVIILCLAVLGVLSASTATAGSSLAQRQASFAADDYRNEVAGQQLYAAADDALASVRAAGGDAGAAVAALEAALPDITAAAQEGFAEGETAEPAADAESGAAEPAADAESAAAEPAPTVQTSIESGTLSAHIQSSSGRCLDIQLEVQPDATLAVTAWKATTLWEEDDTDVIWQGA